MVLFATADKTKFEDKCINKAVNIVTEAAGGKNFIAAYYEGSFPLSMAGMNGGSSVHGRFMVLL